MTDSQKKKGRKRLVLIVGIAAVILAAATGGVWWYTANRQASTMSPGDDAAAEASVDGVLDARVLLDQGRVDEAVQLYDGDVERAGSSAEKLRALIAKSDFLIEANKPDEAYATAIALVGDYKEEAVAYAAQARAQVATGRKAEAIASYERAIELLGDTAVAGRADPKAYYSARLEELR